jgi:outer membrane protein assembly factor BamB
MSNNTYAVSGTDNRNYYLYCENSGGNSLYVYDTYTELWSELSTQTRVVSFAHNKNGMYMLCDNGEVLQLDSGKYDASWSFETDLITNKTVNIKHIKKLQMLVDIPSRLDSYQSKNATMKVYILYDDEVFNADTSHLVYTRDKQGKFPIRVKPRKTANYGFKLHFEGIGYIKLYELEIFIEAGGDLYV